MSTLTPSKAPAADAELAAFVRALPKAELHIHIEGSLEPELMFALARRNGIAVPYADEAALRRAYVFGNLQEFLNVYHEGTRVLRTEQDFYDMAWAYLQRAAHDGVVHAEIFFDTQTHTGHGISADTVIQGLWRACQDAPRLGLRAGLILCFLRHLSEAEAFEALEQAQPHLDKLLGVGLASSELGHPPEKFAQVFAQARRWGLRAVAHAGEEGPPAYIWGALDVLKAERIDHGVQALKDAALVERLVRAQVPLTVCPFSNVKLRVCPDLAQHPLPAMMQAGLVVTINSDDPAYFGGYLADNYSHTLHALGLGATVAMALARNSLQASFMDQASRQRQLDALDAVVQTWGR
jgi:adenosine deaminase